MVNAKTLGYPVASLRDIPAGDYYVQAPVSIYTEFHRADGRVLWLHNDQWEGQQFNTSPGNLVSEVQTVHFDPASANIIQLQLAMIAVTFQHPTPYFDDS